MARTIDRPGDLESLIGQAELRARLQIVMAGARLRESKPPHILLSGPAGTGKTTLAGIIAKELGAKLVTTTGPALRRASDLAGILFSLEATDGVPAVLFIDEIHQMPALVEETLYEVLEDGKLSVVTGSSESARSVSLDVPALVCVGATTKPGALSKPLRDRFGFHAATAPYTDEELAEIVAREWRRFGSDATEGAALLVGRRAKGVPRIALHLAARVMDVAAILEGGITEESARRALEAFGVGDGGLDETDWRILETLCVTFRGRAVGLEALAQALDVDAATIEREHEGALVRAGLVLRTPGGRTATPAAYEVVKAGRWTTR